MKISFGTVWMNGHHSEAMKEMTLIMNGVIGVKKIQVENANATLRVVEEA